MGARYSRALGLVPGWNLLKRNLGPSQLWAGQFFYKKTVKKAIRSSYLFNCLLFADFLFQYNTSSIRSQTECFLACGIHPPPQEWVVPGLRHGLSKCSSLYHWRMKHPYSVWALPLPREKLRPAMNRRLPSPESPEHNRDIYSSHLRFQLQRSPALLFPLPGPTCTLWELSHGDLQCPWCGNG